MDAPTVGDTHTVERTFTSADVEAFAEVTRDTQDRHTDPDDEGRRMVHGLLTGSLLTEIGGELAVLARSMDFHFLRPVYTGQTVRCSWRNERVEEREDGWDLTARVDVERLEGATREGEGGTDRVLEATVEGLVLRDDR